MSYFLVVAIVIAVLAVLYVWYVTRGLNSIADDTTLSLETEEDKLLIHWYRASIQPSYDFNVNDLEIAATYLRRVHDVEVCPSLLVVGSNLEAQYQALTRKSLSTRYTPRGDCFFDIRSNLAKDGEIAIIHDPTVRAALRRNNTVDLTEVSLIISNEMDLMARDYIQEVLKIRWGQIRSLNDPHVLNQNGSYVYLRVNKGSETISKEIAIGLPVTVLDRVTAFMTPKGARLNLLCTNYEFETLMKRWKQHLATPTLLLQ